MRATFQPLSTPPITLSTGTRASVEEDLAELGVAVHLHERSNLDAGLAHVDHHPRDAGVLGHVGVGAGEQHPPLADVGARSSTPSDR